MSPRSLLMASRGRRTPGKPGRFDPTEPLHMTTRHAARNGRPNGTSPTNDSIDGSDSRRGSIDDLRPTTSQSLGSQSSTKGRRGLGSFTDEFADAILSLDSRSLSEMALKRDFDHASSQLPSPSRKRKRSSPTPLHTPEGDDDITAPTNNLMYSDPPDEVEVVPPDGLSDRDSDGTSDSDQEQYTGSYGLAIQSTDISPEATPAGSGAVSPTSEDSQDARILSKSVDVVVAEPDQIAENGDNEDLDDAEDPVDIDGGEDVDDIDDDVDDQGRVGYDGKPRRRLAGRRRAEHHDPIIEATLRRQLQLKSAYRAIARALKPVLAEIALKSTEELDADPVLHERSIEYQGTEDTPGIQQMLDHALAKRRAQLDAQWKWNKMQLLQTWHGESKVRRSRLQQQVDDLQQMQIDRLQHDMLTLARQLQLSADHVGYETEDEDADVIVKPKGMGYRFQRSDALDSKYDSRSRLALESERAIHDLQVRFEMQQMIHEARDEEEEESESSKTPGFTVMDNRARDAALVRRDAIMNTNLLANAAAEAERLTTEAERKAKVPIIANKDAFGLQVLGDLASRPSVRSSMPTQPFPPLPPAPGSSAMMKAPVRQREQPFSASSRIQMPPPTPVRQTAPMLRPPISFERRPHDPPPRTTAFPDPFNLPPPPPLTARPENIPGATRRLADPPRRFSEIPRRIPESPRRMPESPRRVPESPSFVQESPLRMSESARRPPESRLREPGPPPSTHIGGNIGSDLAPPGLRAPVTALPSRRDSLPRVREKQYDDSDHGPAVRQPEPVRQALRNRHDYGESDWQGFKHSFDRSPRPPTSIRRSVHEFSHAGPLSIERVEPVEPQEVKQEHQRRAAQAGEEATKDVTMSGIHNSGQLLAQGGPLSNLGPQDSRPERERSPPAPTGDLMRDSTTKQPRSRTSSISQSTNAEADPDDAGMADATLRQAKYRGGKSLGHKSSKADRNGMTRKAYKHKGPTIHRFRLGQMDSTPASTPASASWHGVYVPHSVYPHDYYAQYGPVQLPPGGGPPIPPAPVGYPQSYGQGYGPQYQHQNGLPPLNTGSVPWPPPPQSPLYSVPQSAQPASAGAPPPTEQRAPPPGFGGLRQGPPTPQQAPAPGPYTPQYGGPAIAPATPDARLMQAGTSRATNHPPAFAQQQRKEEANPRRRTQSDTQGHKFQHYEPRRT